MIQTANLGYPRIGLNRELKVALEKYWKNNLTISELTQTAEQIQLVNWQIQKENGVDVIPCNDFSLYDHVLDTAIMLGVIPERFLIPELADKHDRYFAMARGFQSNQTENIHALEMTKWFNTNYHYLVPEISPDTALLLDPEKIINSYTLSKNAGFETRPVLLGPVSFLLLSKSHKPGFNPLSKLPNFLEIYKELFEICSRVGIEWLQLDEPFLICDLNQESKAAFKTLFNFIHDTTIRPKLMLTTYFADIQKNMGIIHESSCEGIHIDCTNTSDFFAIFPQLPEVETLSLGIIDGRNIWRADLYRILETLKEIINLKPMLDILLTPSCSLIHVPQDVILETQIDEDIKSWLSFAKQKLEELNSLKETINNGYLPNELLNINKMNLENRRAFQAAKIAQTTGNRSSHNHDDQVYQRHSSFIERKRIQKQKLKLPILPTTTIGSFPQTTDVRNARAKYLKKEISQFDYDDFIKQHIKKAIKLQEEMGLDVLVHGEFERNDMVQYFAEKMEGFLFTQHGWVQSFGSRYVRPPIIYTHVSRTQDITVAWIVYAQSLTSKPVKGMLTGPVTILQWSFVRDDQPRAITCREIAHAIRQEVKDLEKNGISIIQIDEPALREGLPLRKSDWDDYLSWAVACFKISSSGVKDETQIHTHMCYAEFNEIIDSIHDMDADVISLEASRSGMQLLSAFKEFKYGNDVGPGVYDIHSPNIPSVEQIKHLIEKALEVIPAENLWINPDCGLKTRNWEEVIPSLSAMVNAAKQVRDQIDGSLHE